jgi:hypothetical protein
VVAKSKPSQWRKSENYNVIPAEQLRKTGNISKVKLMSLKRIIKTKILEICTEAKMN